MKTININELEKVIGGTGLKLTRKGACIGRQKVAETLSNAPLPDKVSVQNILGNIPCGKGTGYPGEEEVLQ